MAIIVCDTGPLTHLWQIDLWHTFSCFKQIHLTTKVVQEVERHVTLNQLEIISQCVVHFHRISQTDLAVTKQKVPTHLKLQPADLETLALARQLTPDWVLTDDLALRQAIEVLGHRPMGSVGVLLRAYQAGLLSLEQLDQAIDNLFVHSTLYLSPQFKGQVRKLIAAKVASGKPSC